MSKKGKIALIVGIAIMVIALAGGGVFYWYVTKPDKEPEQKQPVDDYNEPEEELNYHTVVYKCTYGMYSAKKDYSCKEEVKIPTKTENAKALAIEGKFVLYEDEVLRIYNLESKKSKKIKLKNEYSDYALNLNSDNDNVEGIIYHNGDKNYGYYNLKSDQKLYENKYAALYALNESFIQGSSDTSKDNINLYVLNADEEKVITNREGHGCEFFSHSSNGGFIFYDDGCIDSHVSEIYTKNFKLITDDIEDFAISSNGELYNLENDKVRVYNSKGNVIKTHLLSDTILDIFEDYYLAHDDEKLYIRDYSDYERELGPWSKDTFYHSMISGYYEENALQNENEKEAGYYFIVQKNSELGGIEYYFDPKTKETKSWELPEIGGYAKPVLYLYPEKVTYVTVDFEHESNLTTTYPKFKDSWKVLAKPNGDLYDEDGKYYYGLYWEENSNHQVDFSEGFYVTKDNAIDFLEEKLSIIGLSDRESNEFIMYWLPVLEKNQQSVVYFELTEEREAFNKLEITPKPDSLLRVAIHVKKVNKSTNIKEQELPTFKRKGFVAVEWGGVLYN